MTVVRGKGRGLELMFADRAFGEALVELQARLDERSTFYNGSSATAVFGALAPSPDELTSLQSILTSAGVTLAALAGPPELEALAAQSNMAFTLRAAVTPGEELVRRRANRPARGPIELSEAARSLAADFAGARADLAARRTAPLRQFTPAAAAVVPPAPVAALPVPAAATSTTHYHVGTVRGGQSLHHVGNLVVMGDVNPGSELVASGDIVVFGSLRGVAHAGAQGDRTARVYALELAATQLRIATFIAADDAARKGHSPGAEVACVLDERITIVPLEQAQQLIREELH
ncbi:MAG: hypothetical protein NVSMB31_04510 [Vulcanimicrobiaceae bacterium]